MMIFKNYQQKELGDTFNNKILQQNTSELKKQKRNKTSIKNHKRVKKDEDSKFEQYRYLINGSMLTNFIVDDFINKIKQISSKIHIFNVQDYLNAEYSLKKFKQDMGDKNTFLIPTLASKHFALILLKFVENEYIITFINSLKRCSEKITRQFLIKINKKTGNDLLIYL